MASGDVVPVETQEPVDPSPVDPAPVEEDAADDAAASAKPKEKKAKEPKEKKPRKPRAPPSHPPYAEVCIFSLSLSLSLSFSVSVVLNELNIVKPFSSVRRPPKSNLCCMCLFCRSEFHQILQNQTYLTVKVTFIL
jgi:hypothetical protein